MVPSMNLVSRSFLYRSDEISQLRRVEEVLGTHSGFYLLLIRGLYICTIQSQTNWPNGSLSARKLIHREDVVESEIIAKQLGSSRAFDVCIYIDANSVRATRIA